MKTTKNVKDYRDILKLEFEKRAKVNSRYSLRAFARDIDINPGRLSHVLNGTYGLSVDAGMSISEKLDFDEKQKELFCNLIEAKHGRSIASKMSAKKKLIKSSHTYSDIELDEFKIISEWYHFPIIELTLTENFQYSKSWIAKQLGISEIEVKNALERLIKVGLLIHENGELSPSSRFYVNQKSVPNESVKKYHKQILEKAIQAIETQSTQIRDFAATTVAISRDDIPYVKKKLKEFRTVLDKELSSRQSRNFVYTLSTQFFCMQNDKPNFTKN
jgi:uncharacterized protein (TIGR02147 family)